jgi:hypothetical protein
MRDVLIVFVIDVSDIHDDDDLNRGTVMCDTLILWKEYLQIQEQVSRVHQRYWKL